MPPAEPAPADRALTHKWVYEQKPQRGALDRPRLLKRARYSGVPDRSGARRHLPSNRRAHEPAESRDFR